MNDCLKIDSKPILYNSKLSALNYKRGEMYFVKDIGLSVGNEIRKTRPAVIVSDSTINKDNDVLVVVYLTSKVKKCTSTHIKVMCAGVQAMALIEQVTTITVERIDTSRYLGKLTDQEMLMIDYALSRYLGLCKVINTPENKILKYECDYLYSALIETQGQLRESREDLEYNYANYLIYNSNDNQTERIEQIDMSKKKKANPKLKSPAEINRIDKIFNSLNSNDTPKFGDLERGDIYYIINEHDIGLPNAIGTPGVIVTISSLNKSENIIGIVPLSREAGENSKTTVLINNNVDVYDISYAICNSITTVKMTQLGDYKTKVSAEELIKIDQAIIYAYGLKETFNLSISVNEFEANSEVRKTEALLFEETTVQITGSLPDDTKNDDNICDKKLLETIDKLNLQLSEMKSTIEKNNIEYMQLRALYDGLLDKILLRHIPENTGIAVDSSHLDVIPRSFELNCK